MDFKCLSKRFSDELIIYVPDIEFPETFSIAEKCYPALRFLKNDPSNCYEYFYILESEIGECEEHSEKISHFYTDYFGGKEKIEEEFLSMTKKLRTYLRNQNVQ
ncbi:MAG: hypothetical protein WC915_06770 [archaeon]|jgi:hypothetical protein